MILSAVRACVQWNVVLELKKKNGILKHFLLVFFSLIFHLFLNL